MSDCTDAANKHFQAGEALFEKREYENEKACEKYEQAIKLQLDYIDDYHVCECALKQYQEATEEYHAERVIILAKVNFDWRGIRDISHLEEWNTIYQEVSDKLLGFAKNYFGHGKNLFISKQYEDAIEKYQEATKNINDLAKVYFNWGNILYRLQQYEDAIEKYQKATKINPNYASSYYNIAYIYWIQGNYKEGRKKWQEAVGAYKNSKDNDADHFFNYGNVHRILDDLDKAEEEYQAGLAIAPNNIDILIALVKLYIQKTEQEDTSGKLSDNWGKARQAYRKARNLLENQPHESEDVTTFLKLGNLHLKMEEYEEAENYLIAALKKDGDSAKIKDSLGVLYIRKEDFNKSVQYFKAALKISPDDLDVRSNLAEAYLKLKQLTNAEKEHRKVLSITDYHVESHIGLGEVYVAMGDEGETDMYNQALSHFDKAIKISDDAEGSKVLSPKELSAVHYLKGYARVKLYENSTVMRDKNLLSNALEDFKNCVKSDPEHFKGARAKAKLKKQVGILHQPQENWGRGVILILLFIVFFLTQCVFWKPFLIQDTKFLASQESVKVLKAETTKNEKKQENSSKSETINTSNKTQTSNLLNTTDYFLLTFGLLTFSLVSLYLPQILKLKISGTGIELEKSSIDQTKIPTSLGIIK